MKANLRLALVFLCATALLVGMAGAEPKKLLVVSVTVGFRHSSIETGDKVIEELGRKSGVFAADFVQQPSQRPASPKAPVRNPKDSDEQWKVIEAKFQDEQVRAKADDVKWMESVKALLAEKLSVESLKKYDGIIFNNTTGDLPLPDREGFLAWIRAGHAFVGMHAATDTLKGWPDYVAMINGNFAGHPCGAGTTVTINNHEPSHPCAEMFPGGFEWKDEIYQYNSFDPGAVRLLLSLDMEKTKPQMPYLVPISWVREFGDARLFYTNLGHNESTWVDPKYQDHILTGIKWALKLIDGPAAPNPQIAEREAVKSFVAVAAPLTRKDPVALEEKIMVRARTQPGWMDRMLGEIAEYRKLPTLDVKKAKPEEIAVANGRRLDFLSRMVAEIENESPAGGRQGPENRVARQMIRAY